MPRERPALAPCRLAALRKRVPVRRRQRAALAFRIIAAVVSHDAAVALLDRRGVGHLLRRNEIAAAHFVAREVRTSSAMRRECAPSRMCLAGGRRRASARPAPYWSGTARPRECRPAAHRARSCWSRRYRAARRHKAHWRRDRDRAVRECRRACRRHRTRLRRPKSAAAPAPWR